MATTGLVVVLASCGSSSEEPQIGALETTTTPVAEPSALPPTTGNAVSTSLIGPPAPAEAGLPELDASQESAIRLLPVIEQTIPHDTGSYTQGLLIEDGHMFESAGQTGQSNLREIDPVTGEVIRRVDNDSAVFAEGLELVGDRLIQLTWRAGVAYVWDVEDFALLDTYRYDGEGWGLCFDGERLVMSDGSASLTFRDPSTFEPIGQVGVTLNGRPVERLNELECVGGYVLANVWQTDEIMVIDPGPGRVVGHVDGSELKRAADAMYEGAEVFNGIAYDESTDRFHLTGKYWPLTFVVRFAAAP